MPSVIWALLTLVSPIGVDLAIPIFVTEILLRLLF